MKCSIVLFPSKKLQDIANSYRKRYDPNYALIPPHLSLKPLFEASDEEVDILVSKLKSTAKKLNPLTIQITKYSSFAPVNNVIYMKVEPTKELIQLQKAIENDALEKELEYPFVPHVTVAQKLSEDEHSDVLGRLRMTDVSYEETIDRFHLLTQLDNGSWTVYDTFILGEGEK
jgi:2'-5' RNA ligase